MSQTQNYARKLRKLGLVHINSQFKQVALKTKIKPTEYVHSDVRVLEMNSITLYNVTIKQSQKLDLDFKTILL